jgi:hypothetical protein
MKNLKTFDPKKRRIVMAGTILGDVFKKRVGKKHFMIKYNGYGIQNEVLDKLIREKVKTIEITTHEGNVLKSDIADWVARGKSKSHGHGRQTFLDINFMEGFR